MKFKYIKNRLNKKVDGGSADTVAVLGTIYEAHGEDGYGVTTLINGDEILFELNEIEIVEPWGNDVDV